MILGIYYLSLPPYQDKKVEGWTALKAREAGIETVFQDRALCPQQSIVWNIFMGKELTYPFGFIREKEQIREANRLSLIHI